MSEHKYEFGDWVEVRLEDRRWLRARYIKLLDRDWPVWPHQAHVPELNDTDWFADSDIRPAQPPTGECPKDAAPALLEALEMLMDVQNGPPLYAWANDWNKAMATARAAIAAAKGVPQ